MKKVERLGSGIEKMKTLMREANLEEPRFESDSFFHVIFYRNPEYALKPFQKTGTEKVPERVTVKVPEKVTVNQKKILDMLARNGYTTIAELSSRIGISERKIKTNISKLKDKGYLHRIGPDKGGYWKVIARKQ